MVVMMTVLAVLAACVLVLLVVLLLVMSLLVVPARWKRMTAMQDLVADEERGDSDAAANEPLLGRRPHANLRGR